MSFNSILYEFEPSCLEKQRLVRRLLLGAVGRWIISVVRMVILLKLEEIVDDFDLCKTLLK